MMTTATAETTRGRRCGADALAAILARHEVPVDRERLWIESAVDDPFGGVATRSFRLAALAVRYGLEAAVLQCHATRGLEAIRDCHRHGVSLIINHQTPWARHEGHYSRLADIDHDTVTLHDPTLDVHLTHPISTFLSLWQRNREAAGFVLIAIDSPQPAIDSPQPAIDAARCPRCRGEIRFRPAILFRPAAWSREGWWRRFFCVTCDASFAPRDSNGHGVVRKRTADIEPDFAERVRRAGGGRVEAGRVWEGLRDV